MRMSVKYNFSPVTVSIFVEKNYEKNYFIRIDQSRQRLAVY